MKLMNWFLCCVATGFVLALPGCGKKNTKSSNAPDPMLVIPAESATPGSGGKPASAQEESNTAADLEMLNKNLREYVRLNGINKEDVETWIKNQESERKFDF